MEAEATVTAAVIRRLPLAEAAFWLLRWACDPDRLQSLWDRFRGRGYERVISFATLVRLVSEALLLYRGSGRRTFEKNIVAARLDASVAAAFGKLGRLPLSVSQAFLEDTTAAVSELLVPANVAEPPVSLRAFHPVILDGKTIKRVQKRLKPLRGIAGGVIGGKALVGLDGRTGLVLAMEAHPDGDSSEQQLVPGLLERVRRRVPGSRLLIADGAFGNLVQAERFSAEGDHFVVRLHPSCRFTADPDRPVVVGRDADGHRVSETWGIAGSPWNRRRRAVRRIAIDRDGDTPVVLITDLLDPAVYPVADLLAAYRNRHDIERVFQQTTEVFGLTRLIGSRPLAGLFQFAFCLVLYNLVQILRGYLAEAADQPADRLSSEKLFDEVRDQLVAWRVVIPPDQTDAYFATLADRPGLIRHLRTILTDAWCPTWTKTPPQPHRRVDHPPSTRSHSSVQRLLDAARRKSPPKPTKHMPLRC